MGTSPDPDELERLYWDENMTQAEIADHAGVTPAAIHRAMDRNDIPRRKRMDEVNRKRRKGDRIITNGTGYETWRYGRHQYVRLHRLAAVAKYGFDAVGSGEVHHRNRIPWDNRLSNIVVLGTEEHQRMHADQQEREPGGEFR